MKLRKPAQHLFALEIERPAAPNRLLGPFHNPVDAKDQARHIAGEDIEWTEGTSADTFVARSHFMGDAMYVIRQVPVL